MTTTARRALSELIDQLCTVPEVPDAPPAQAVVEPVLQVAAEPVAPPAPVLPVQRAPEPAARQAAVTVLPGGARTAILWRSRTA